ncbi:hypothetical protein EDD99_0057 [Streptomyces sp. 846.5]|nr:hypothetical protein [Streptomyces sp. 846.5]TDU01691.1 hypothetical protein EDD99_0057 [Streptomyces sp. 846.5]
MPVPQFPSREWPRPALLTLTVATATTLLLVPARAASAVTPPAQADPAATALPGHAAAGTPANVAVDSAGVGRVDTGFAGFSYEKDRVGAGMFNTQDTSLVQLFQLLGSSVLRVGGNLGDIVNWNAGGPGGSAEEIAPADVTKLAGFLHATHWKVIYGINLKTNTAANAASEAQFAAKALGSSLLAFEIGNEPNFYTTESGYEASYNAYVSAIKAKVPGAVFDGPGGGDSTSWAASFASHEKNNSLAILSTHLYIGKNTTGTIPGMLASNDSGRLPNAESAMAGAASAGGAPVWRMTEANSYYDGGTAGVSNVEAASLWSLDFMAGVAAHGGAGVNFHGGTSTQFPLNYSPIAYSGLTPTGVQGVYYGELLWELGGTGTFHKAAATGATGVTAWGIGNNVFVNNRSAAPIKATVTLRSAVRNAREYLLTAPSPASTAITVAGSGVDARGTFSPSPKSVKVTGGRTVVVNLPADSVALIVDK